jgi:hypothetical protein
MKKSFKKINIRFRKKSKKNICKQRGGRTGTIIENPSITYNNSSLGNNQNPPIILLCNHCRNNKFQVKTLTKGTKIKDILGFDFLNSRFKSFECTYCGGLQEFSNDIKCSGKECN